MPHTMKNLDPVEIASVELFSKMSNSFGGDSLFFKIFVLSYISPEPISMEELADKTGYSLASLSTRIKMFEAAGFLNKTRKPGSKKVYVSAEKNMIKMFRDHFMKKEELGMQIVMNEVPGIAEDLRKKKLTALQKKKLENLENYYTQVTKMHKIMKKMIIEFEKLDA